MGTWLIGCRNVSFYMFLVSMVFGTTNEGGSERASHRLQDSEACQVRVGCHLYQITHPPCRKGVLYRGTSAFTVRLRSQDCHGKTASSPSFTQWTLLLKNRWIPLRKCSNKTFCRMQVGNHQSASHSLVIQISPRGASPNNSQSLRVSIAAPPDKRKHNSEIDNQSHDSSHSKSKIHIPSSQHIKHTKHRGRKNSTPVEDTPATSHSTEDINIQDDPKRRMTKVGKRSSHTRHPHRKRQSSDVQQNTEYNTAGNSVGEEEGNFPRQLSDTLQRVPLGYDDKGNLLSYSAEGTEDSPAPNVPVKLTSTQADSHRERVDMLRQSREKARAIIYSDISKHEMNELQNMQGARHLHQTLHVPRSDSDQAPAVHLVRRGPSVLHPMDRNNRPVFIQDRHITSKGTPVQAEGYPSPWKLSNPTSKKHFHAWGPFLRKQHRKQTSQLQHAPPPHPREAVPGYADQSYSNLAPMMRLEAVLKDIVHVYGLRIGGILQTLDTLQQEEIPFSDEVHRQLWRTVYGAMQQALEDVSPPREPAAEAGGSWSVWGYWEPCSQTCGAAFRVRRRMCQDVHRGCLGNSVEYEECHNPVCSPAWLEWGDWSKCSSSCGPGLQSRQRMCLTSDLSVVCPGKAVSLEDCQGVECWQRIESVPTHVKSIITQDSDMEALQGKSGGHWAVWTVWTHCSATCGVGRHMRQRTCRKGRCEGQDRQSRPCSMGSCDSVYFSRYVEVDEGKRAVLRCKPKMRQAADVYWKTPQDKIIHLKDVSSKYKIKGTDLWIMSVQVSDRGVYRCVVNRVNQTPFISDSALEVLDCNSGPCRSGGQCMEETDPSNPNLHHFSCICPNGFSGPLCEKEFPRDYKSLIIGLVILVLILLIISGLLLFWLYRRRKKERKCILRRHSSGGGTSLVQNIEEVRDSDGEVTGYHMVDARGRCLGDLPKDYRYKPVLDMQGQVVSYFIVDKDDQILGPAPLDRSYTALQDADDNIISYIMEDSVGRLMGPAPLLVHPVFDQNGDVTGYSLVDDQGNTIGPAPVDTDARFMSSVAPSDSKTGQTGTGLPSQESESPAAAVTESVRPNSAYTESVRPDSAYTETVRPGNANTETVRPTAAYIESIRPGNAVTETIRRDSANTESLRPGNANTETVRRNSGYTESARRNSVKTESVRPDSAYTESDRPAAANTETVRRNSANTESARRNSAYTESARRNSAYTESDRPAAANTETVRRNSAKTESVRRDSASTESFGPAAANTETVRRASANTESDRRASANTESARRASANTESVRRASANTESDRPAAAYTESVRHNSAKTESLRRESANTDSARRDSANTESLRSAAAYTESTRPGTANSESAMLDAAHTESASGTAGEQSSGSDRGQATSEQEAPPGGRDVTQSSERSNEGSLHRGSVSRVRAGITRYKFNKSSHTQEGSPRCLTRRQPLHESSTPLSCWPCDGQGGGMTTSTEWSHSHHHHFHPPHPPGPWHASPVRVAMSGEEGSCTYLQREDDIVTSAPGDDADHMTSLPAARETPERCISSERRMASEKRLTSGRRMTSGKHLTSEVHVTSEGVVTELAAPAPEPKPREAVEAGKESSSVVEGQPVDEGAWRAMEEEVRQRPNHNAATESLTPSQGPAVTRPEHDTKGAAASGRWAETRQSRLIPSQSLGPHALQAALSSPARLHSKILKPMTGSDVTLENASRPQVTDTGSYFKLRFHDNVQRPTAYVREMLRQGVHCDVRGSFAARQQRHQASPSDQGSRSLERGASLSASRSSRPGSSVPSTQSVLDRSANSRHRSGHVTSDWSSPMDSSGNHPPWNSGQTHAHDGVQESWSPLLAPSFPRGQGVESSPVRSPASRRTSEREEGQIMATNYSHGAPQEGSPYTDGQSNARSSMKNADFPQTTDGLRGQGVFPQTLQHGADEFESQTAALSGDADGWGPFKGSETSKNQSLNQGSALSEDSHLQKDKLYETQDLSLQENMQELQEQHQIQQHQIQQQQQQQQQRGEEEKQPSNRHHLEQVHRCQKRVPPSADRIPHSEHAEIHAQHSRGGQAGNDRSVYFEDVLLDDDETVPLLLDYQSEDKVDEARPRNEDAAKSLSYRTGSKSAFDPDERIKASSHGVNMTSLPSSLSGQERHFHTRYSRLQGHADPVQPWKDSASRVPVIGSEDAGIPRQRYLSDYVDPHSLPRHPSLHPPCSGLKHEPTLAAQENLGNHCSLEGTRRTQGHQRGEMSHGDSGVSRPSRWHVPTTQSTCAKPAGTSPEQLERFRDGASSERPRSLQTWHGFRGGQPLQLPGCAPRPVLSAGTPSHPQLCGVHGAHSRGLPVAHGDVRRADRGYHGYPTSGRGGDSGSRFLLEMGTHCAHLRHQRACAHGSQQPRVGTSSQSAPAHPAVQHSNAASPMKTSGQPSSRQFSVRSAPCLLHSKGGDSATRGGDSGTRRGDSTTKGHDSASKGDDSGSRGIDSTTKGGNSGTRGGNSTKNVSPKAVRFLLPDDSDQSSSASSSQSFPSDVSHVSLPESEASPDQQD